jgi:hypothetical protein
LKAGTGTGNNNAKAGRHGLLNIGPLILIFLQKLMPQGLPASFYVRLAGVCFLVGAAMEGFMVSLGNKLRCSTCSKSCAHCHIDAAFCIALCAAGNRLL